eukprot:g4301.t1
MSLFQAREWWSTQVSEDEEFDVGCLCVANVDNEPTGANKIIMGSYQGMLRMYYPKQKEYKIEDLILESNVEAPILQIEAGRFVQGSRDTCMSLLHPMKLSVYMVSAVSSGSSVNYYSMVPAYEHKLLRPAFNMCYGSFGGVKDRDYFCIQSLDGVLSFFEQESFAFSRMISASFLVPGPICYVPKIDSFVICTNAMCIEAYRYQALKLCFGIEVVRFTRSLSASQQEILVVGEQTVFTLKEILLVSDDTTVSMGLRGRLFEHSHLRQDSGGIRLQKRLAEYGITASIAYKMPAESPDALANHNLILGTNTGHLLILKEMQLVWCARLQGMVPAQICVDTLGGIRGMMVLMDYKGKLQACYLGTDPPTASLVNTEMKDWICFFLNYDEMEEEHQDLLRIIRQTHGDGAAEPEESLTVEAQVPQVLDLGMNEDDCDADDPVGRSDGMVMQLTVHIMVTLRGSKPVENVSITLKAPQCFHLSQSSVFIEKVDPGAPPVIVPILVRVWNKILCSGLEVMVCAAYFSMNNEPRTAATTFGLPFALAKPIPPVKSANHKIQLDCNKQPPALQTLFAGLLNQPHVSPSLSQGMSNLLSIQYVSGTEATVLVLKSSGRFCVQATEFAALWVLTEERTTLAQGVKELCRRARRADLLDQKQNSTLICLGLVKDLGAPRTEVIAGIAGGHTNCQLDKRSWVFFVRSSPNDWRQEPFFITFQDSLPLHDYFALIDDHFELRRHLDELRKDLADRTQQYRVIQKRLLVRFKDRNPSPLNHLDTLLNLTFEQTILLTDAIDDVEQALRTVSCHLSAATELILLLIKFRFGLDEDNFSVLRRHFSPEICDTTEQGWEEKVDTSLLHLLRTSLARSAKDRNTLPPPMKVFHLGSSPKSSPQKAVQDTMKLRKRITNVVDRLATGARVTDVDSGGPVVEAAEEEIMPPEESTDNAADAGSNNTSGKGSLADQVKRGQRESKGFKQRWWDYCDKYGKGFYDPHRHEQRLLEERMRHPFEEVKAVQAEVDEEEKLLADKASRMKEAEERLDKAIAQRIKEAKSKAQKAAETKLEEGLQRIRADAAKALQDAKAKAKADHAEKVQQVEKRLSDAKARLATLKGKVARKGSESDASDAKEKGEKKGSWCPRMPVRRYSRGVGTLVLLAAGVTCFTLPRSIGRGYGVDATAPLVETFSPDSSAKWSWAVPVGLALAATSGRGAARRRSGRVGVSRVCRGATPYPDGVYNADSAASYFQARPWMVTFRATELMSTTVGFAVRLLLDLQTGSWEANSRARAQELVQILTDLGPTFIKIGQALSIRADLLSPAYLEALTELQDRVPPFPTDKADEIIESELGRPVGEIFEEISPAPIASASLGQVYRAKLREGPEVAVKVQRPGMEEVVALDLFLLKLGAGPLRAFLNLTRAGLNTDIPGLVDEWGKGFVGELDYRQEAANAVSFSQDITHTPLGGAVFAPEPVDSCSSQKVLTTEWIVGERLETSSAEAGVGLCILDWGLVTKLDPSFRVAYIEHIAHLVSGDYEPVPRDLVALGFVPEGMEGDVIQSEVVGTLADVYGQWSAGGGAKQERILSALKPPTPEISTEF